MRSRNWPMTSSFRNERQTSSSVRSNPGKTRARSPRRRAIWLYVLHREAVSFKGRLCHGLRAPRQGRQRPGLATHRSCCLCSCFPKKKGDSMNIISVLSRPVLVLAFAALLIGPAAPAVAGSSDTNNLRDVRYCEVIPSVVNGTITTTYVYNTLTFN